ncbi:nacht and ankyrin domain-containing [Fusarium albosuccineum]|uniref:Nacht and ankyrin domain-containing n=1 Tax=Fusarium albosuccineum TaxID=1237068 RepID=A0A8H4LHB3_9HYPO|nr:nacht and ankyrin domain-containing [Fusarium albosuccineum]
MNRDTDGIPNRQERRQASRPQDKTGRPQPSFQGSRFNNNGTGNLLNAQGGNVNSSQGSGFQFPGSTFEAPVFFVSENQSNALHECVKSLEFPEMDSRLYDIDTAAAGTCEWILLHETYTSWVSSDRALLWIKGKPGSGKSTLLRYILEHTMETTNTGEEDLILSFFFHGRGTELQRTTLGLFRTLLYHLLD